MTKPEGPVGKRDSLLLIWHWSLVICLGMADSPRPKL